MAFTKRKGRGFPRHFELVSCRRDQRSNWSTLCCEVLASASAETAIDWRGDSAWRFAASALGSASVRLDEPGCSTLIRVFEKSLRVCPDRRFEPHVDASVRSDALRQPHAP